MDSESILVEAMSLLASVGASGLCHPTSDEFAPQFPHCDDIPLQDEQEERFLYASSGEKDDWFFIKNGLLATFCVCVAAMAAGLTMGLMSLDPLMLTIKMRAAASQEERKQAAALLPVVQQHHLLLVTLLLLNAMANEALPLFLDELVPSYLAVIMSVTLVLFFGEIIPSAICTGPSQMKLASRLIPLVRFVMILLCPIAYPIAKMLDCLLHDEDELGSMYSRGELTALVRIQYEERLAAKRRHREERAKFQEGRTLSKALVEASKRELVFAEKSNHLSTRTTASTGESPSRPGYQRNPSIHFDEVSMVAGALSMKTKVAIDVYTSLRKVFAVPLDTVLDEKTVVRIYSSGYSRIPVYERNPNKPKDITAICGILMTKQLIVIDSSDCRPLSTLPLAIPFCVSPKQNLVDLINMFQSGNGHIALVCARPALGNAALEEGKALPPNAGLMGVVTLEDALEMLLQEQILDETDKIEREHMRLAQWVVGRWKVFVAQKKAVRSGVAAALDDPRMVDIVNQATALANQAADTDETPLLGDSTSDEETSDKRRVSFLPFL